MMNKEKLENNKSALELLLNENSDKCTDYKAQLSIIEKELEESIKQVKQIAYFRLNEIIDEQ